MAQARRQACPRFLGIAAAVYMTAALATAAAQTEGESGANQTNANATQSKVPYLHGRWRVNFRYSEVKGNVGLLNGCEGVWPYIYTIEYELYQRRGSPEYVLCRVGDDCAKVASAYKTLEQSSFDVFETNCALREHSVADSALDQFLVAQYIRQAQLPDIFTTHTEEFERVYGYPKNELGKQTLPMTWHRFRAPGMMEMSRNPTEEELQRAQENPWARICDQYDWPDLEELGPGYAPPSYKGALRHENVSWFWIKDLTSCKCFPSCRECSYVAPDASPHFQMVNKTCVKEYGTDIEEDCAYKIVGVGGGPVVYPPATTGKSGEDGEPLICYQYTQIEGFMSIGPEKTPIPPGIDLPGAAHRLQSISALLSIVCTVVLPFSLPHVLSLAA